MIQAEIDLLVMSVQQGNKQAFAMLYRFYLKPLLGFSFKLSNDKEIANDAVQESWIKVSKNIRQLNDPRTFKSWIYRLVRWKTLDLLKARTRRQERFESFDESSQVDDATVTTNLISDSSLDEGLTIAINSLPNTEREMIHLFYLDDLRISEIAIVLNIPSGTVKSRLSRARNLLKTKFKPTES